MNKIKKILFALMLILLILPSLQNRFNIFTIKPLEGDFILQEKPEYSKAGWNTGIFQKNYNNWLEENIGFRSSLVRLTNQIDYSFFRKVHAEGVIIGKNDVLYEYDYIRAYTGGDFIGERTLDKKMRRLKYMQEFLKREKNIHLLFVLEPSKARFEPEYIPNRYKPENRGKTNYEYLVKLSNKYDVTFLDLSNYFLQMKDTVSWPIYPQYGVHWSLYGMSLAVDTLINFIEDQTQLNLPEVYIDSIEISQNLQGTDYDAGKPLNLMWTLPHKNMAYPAFRFEENPAKDRPNVLAIADSYYWNIFNTRLPWYLFNNQAFWYFNSLVYPDYYYGSTYVEGLDLKTEVEKQDVILIMVTERFQFKYDWGFVDNIHELYRPYFESDYHYQYENDVRMNLQVFDRLALEAARSEESLEDMIYDEADYMFVTENLPLYLETFGPAYYEKLIRSDSIWMLEIKRKAKEQNISADEMLTIDIGYMFRNDYPDIFTKYYEINGNIELIKNDPDWLESVKQKAAEYYLTVDEMIYQDALWMYDNQNKNN